MKKSELKQIIKEVLAESRPQIAIDNFTEYIHKKIIQNGDYRKMADSALSSFHSFRDIGLSVTDDKDKQKEITDLISEAQNLFHFLSSIDEKNPVVQLNKILTKLEKLCNEEN